MLDKHHRAVYRAHSEASKEVGERRVYYVVGQVGLDEFQVLGIVCSPTAPKRELPDGLSHIEELQFYTAQGTTISKLEANAGRWSDESYKHVMNISLAPSAKQAA